MVDSVTHAAVSTNPVVSLLARLSSVIDQVKDSAPASFRHALASSTANSIDPGVSWALEDNGFCPSIPTNLAQDTTKYVSDLRPLVASSIPADHLVPAITTSGKVTSRKEGGLKRYVTPYT